MLRLPEKYQKEVIPSMQEKFGYKNNMAVPKIEKVIVNTGFGRLVSGKTSDEQKKIVDFILDDLALITGQKPILTQAKKSISGFKIQKGSFVGAMVTLRGKRMYDFLNKLVNIVFPRVRDFRGISGKSFDGKGNYSVGFKEHIVFPEISPDDVVKTHGLQINVSTTAKTDEEGFALLKAMGFPFKK